jgi:hypothetical protein
MIIMRGLVVLACGYDSGEDNDANCYRLTNTILSDYDQTLLLCIQNLPALVLLLRLLPVPECKYQNRPWPFTP